MSSSRITEVSTVLGIPVPTIRSWERRYELLAPSRTPGGHRRYVDGEVVTLREMRDEVARGRSAKQAAAVVKRRARAASPDADVLAAAAVAGDGDRIRNVLDRAVSSVPVEDVLSALVFPALSRVDQPWRIQGEVRAAEQLLGREVRNFFSRQVANAPEPFRPFPIILAAAPDELHTLGLEAFAVVLARRGWACRVLPPRTGIDGIVRAVRGTSSGAAVVSAQRSTARRSAIATVNTLSGCGIRTFYAGGAFFTPSSRSTMPGVYLGEELVPAADIFESALGVPPAVPSPARSFESALERDSIGV